MTGYIKKPVQLNEAGIKLPARARPREKKELVVPDEFVAALKKNKKALAVFEETRKQRLATGMAWLAEGNQGIGSTRIVDAIYPVSR